MINRLKIICSNEPLLNKDLKQLKESSLWKQKRENLQNCSLDVPRKQIYFGFQYINASPVKFVQNISKLISKNFNYIKCIPYFKKGRNPLSYFSSKIKGFDKDTSSFAAVNYEQDEFCRQSPTSEAEHEKASGTSSVGGGMASM